MDSSRFDRLSRVLATAPTRRTALATLAALLGRGLVALDDTAAQSRICQPLGGRCFPNRGLDCCRGECRSGRCRCPKGRHRCGNRCLRKGRRCRRQRSQPRRGCRPSHKRCQERCIPKTACCGGCPNGQACRNGGCCDVTTTDELQTALAPGGPDTIRLCPKTTYRGTFTIERSVTVIGAGASSSVLDGAGSGPVVTITNAVTDAVELQGVSIANGAGTFQGGGILAHSPLTLTRCRLANNEAGQGGGLDSTAAVTLVGSTVANNEARFSGGGLHTTASMILVDTVVAGNRTSQFNSGGGGIAVEGSGASLTLRGSSRVELNKANEEFSGGGGIYAYDGAEVRLHDRSQVRRNQALWGGGMYLSGDSTASLQDDSRIEGNTSGDEGGGVNLRPGTHLDMRHRSRITGNKALGDASTGGGIWKAENATVDLPNAAMVSSNQPDQCEPSIPTGDGGTCE